MSDTVTTVKASDVETMASVTEVWRYLAGDTVTSVPAKLTSDQKSRYPLARFRTEWDALSTTERAQFRAGIGNGSFTF